MPGKRFRKEKGIFQVRPDQRRIVDVQLMWEHRQLTGKFARNNGQLQWERT